MSQEDSETITDPFTLKWKQRFTLGKYVMNYFGVPLILLAFLVGGGIVAVRTVWFWGHPIAEEVAREHVAWLKESRKTAETNAETNKQLGVTQDQMATSIAQQTANGKEFVVIANEHKKLTEQIAKQVGEVHKAVVKKPQEE